MPRSVRHHIGIGDSQKTEFKPKHLTKQEFGKRLYSLMNAKGWHQSELARQANLNRDSVSVYIRGKSLPTPYNLQCLAKALGINPEELLPNHVENAIDEDEPSFEMKVSTSSPNMAWLRVNRLVTISTAVKVAELLQDDDVVDRGRSGESAAVQPLQGKKAPK